MKALVKLSPNQTAVLTALAEGYSIKEIAEQWGVSDTVVYRNVEAARKKLGAKTTVQAVAIWVANRASLAAVGRSTNGTHQAGVR